MYIKSYYNDGRRPPLYYYRDSDKKEIDLIIEQDRILYPVEIKKSGIPKKDAIRHFSVLEKKRSGRGAVQCHLPLPGFDAHRQKEPFCPGRIDMML
ncbi:DUF4143 domain-containing protein [uncultured Desulfobacter sp.]|uniref:DUF4143 domain-containing protein n=1 Tax=uncultured Desulfobacter sp. TaxID=240139 RepID=UPI002AA81FB8|nr:DUF4143 domain-containing protein [uncultured Desulfobacter sp.]